MKSKMWLLVVSVLLLPTGAQAGDDKASVSDIATILEESSVHQLGWDKSEVSKTLSQLDGRLEALHAVAVDPDRDDALRYKATEALYVQGGSLKTDEEKADAARIYVDALRNAETHNAWGLPLQSPTGPGRRIVAFGAPALPVLRPLLDDDARLLYEGSEEPTISEMKQYRLSDLAGVYVATILGTDFDVEEDSPEKRDEDLKVLAAQLDSR